MRYSAFISYNHQDRKWATWLHGALEKYRLPKSVIGRDTALGRLDRRLPPVFQDREELAASSDLAESVVAALKDSGNLIVVCSPSGAQSRWVNEEIRTFRDLGRGDRIQCVIVAGDPTAPATSTDACIPPAMFENGGREPLAVDLRPGGDERSAARLKLIAGMLGIGFDELRQREVARRQKRLAMIASAALAGAIFTSALAAYAFISRAEALEQRDIARQKTLTAERTVDFVKSLFEVANPTESRGETITVREALDAGAERLDNELEHEPQVKAELATTLGEVYLGLGLLKKGDKILRQAIGLTHGDPTTRARQYEALARSQYAQGEYQAASNSYARAFSFAQQATDPSQQLVAEILVGAGQARSAVEAFDQADRFIKAGLRLDLQRAGPVSAEVARDLEALGENRFFAGDLKAARPIFERALAIRRRVHGDTHPEVAENINTLGAIAYMQRDSASAERYYRQALKQDEVVLGQEHPDLAGSLNNLARVLLERREFQEARQLLRRATGIYARERGSTHDDLAFILANLAMAEASLGDSARAEELYQQALSAARKHHHRNLGPILTDLAELRCREGRPADGLPLLKEAAAATKKDYPDDAWRQAWVNYVRGTCLLRSGQHSEGSALLNSSAPALLERWAPGSYYHALIRSTGSRR